MRDSPRRAVSVLVVLLLAAVVIITVDFREHTGGPVQRLQNAAVSVFGPLERVVTGGLRPVGNFFTSVGQLGSLRQDNARLRAQVQQLQNIARENPVLQRENNQLRAALGMARRCGCRTVAATVVGLSGSNFEWSVTIDAGSSSGIAPGMAVLAGAGVVGKVVQTASDYSVVQLLQDPASGVAARVLRDGATGIVRGQGDGDLSLTLLDSSATAAPGDTIVTLGYPGGVFPPDLPIGIVTGAATAGGNLTPELSVRPYVDFATLDVVDVVVSSPTATRPRTGGRRP